MSTSSGMGFIRLMSHIFRSHYKFFSSRFSPTDPHQALMFSDKVCKHSLLGFQHTAHM